MPRVCGEGKERRMRCVPLKKGRKGQGKGRVTGRVGIGKGPGGACLWGVSRTGKCRTKARYMQHKRAKKNAKYIKRKGLVVPKGIRRPSVTNLDRSDRYRPRDRSSGDK